MDHNPEIKKIFEVADDSLQGVLGYHYYVMANYNAVDSTKILNYLPKDKIPHTYSWTRKYNKNDLMKKITNIFEAYQSRVTLIAMAAFFEVALKEIFNYLHNNGHPQKLPGKNINYKNYIKWAYSEAKKN